MFGEYFIFSFILGGWWANLCFFIKYLWNFLFFIDVFGVGYFRGLYLSVVNYDLF